MTPRYDTSQCPPLDPGIGQRTNMTYDPAPRLAPVGASPPSMAPEADASGPLTGFIDALGNRVGGTGTHPPDDADDPLIVTRRS